MNKYREAFEKYVAEVGRAPHALTRVWALGFCDWLARNEGGLTPRAADVLTHCPNDGNLLLMGFCDQCKSQYPHAANA